MLIMWWFDGKRDDAEDENPHVSGGKSWEVRVEELEDKVRALEAVVYAP